MRTNLLIIVFGLLAGFDALGQSIFKPHTNKFHYEEIKFEDLIKRYFEKELTPLSSLEGIYSVSCVIVKKGKNLFGQEFERAIQRKDNYARVAIIKDRATSSRDYIEVSLSYREADKYPVMGEFNGLSEGRGLIYNHFEPDGTTLSFSMKNESEVMDGEYSIMEGARTITYKLSYLKIYPKSSSFNVSFD
ncbi:MAG TPA: hypothetical protein VFW11_07460 [Cyclobacteriaceae bacterium]|nr:hypothetical protein [Cyclobacteriaceae bacterium]